MSYKCIRPDGARPCIYDSRFDPDLRDGTVNGKIIKRYKSVKHDAIVGWVDPCSRKHFVPTNEATKEQDRRDFDKIKSKLKDLNVKLPDNVDFITCAESLTRLEASKADKKTKTRRVLLEPSEEVEEVELTNKELKALLDEKGTPYGPQDNKTTLKALLEA